MKLFCKSSFLLLVLSINYSFSLPHNDNNNNNDNDNETNEMLNMMDMNNLDNSIDSLSPTLTSNINNNNNNITPTPWAPMNHGIPILNTKLTPEQRKYWENYNTTTYLTLNSNYQNYINIHLFLLFLSSFILFPFVLILNNLNSNWFLPLSTFQSLISIISCISYSIFINNVPNLYPNMVYTKLITGLYILTILQWFFSLINSIKNWLNPINNFEILLNDYKFINNNTPDNLKLTNIQLNDFCSPSSTLYDDENGDTDSFNLDEINNINNNNNNNNNQGLGLNFSNSQSTFSTPIINNNNNNINNLNLNSISNSKLVKLRNKLLNYLSNFPILLKLANSFGILFTILHNLSIWGLFVYFSILLPTGIACLNLFGKGQRVFNLLAHFIKGGIFFLLGILSLARYCGCFSGMGGAWNFAFIDLNPYNNNNNNNKNINNNNNLLDYSSSGFNGLGSGGDKINNSLFIKFHKLLISNNLIKNSGSLICSFEFMESLLIFIYGVSNVFLEHLASTDGVWTAKDLQHASIAFMYFGAGLCGLITEYKLLNWRKSLFFNITANQLALVNNDNINNLSIDNKINLLSKDKLVTPGFSPNPFPVFTIFWTGILMSKHAQPSSLSTSIHVQWGSLLTYGSFFRIFTFILMSYYPLRDSNQCFLPSKPLTELITSFCLLAGGMVFMESTDQVIEALAYRGLTPMFTINVSVGIISLIMAWVMLLFTIKDKLRAKKFSTFN